ncbi:MAG: FAD-binding protein [Desulfuromonadales bacterium]|nr:FAD-binding protein [Desulfuromonadales bacterium]
MRYLSSSKIELFNTLGLGSRCSDIRVISDPEELSDYLLSLDATSRSNVNVAGELSNTLLGEVLDTPLILYRDGSVIDISKSKNSILVHVAGSCRFDYLVDVLCEQGIPGLELLSGIPGTVGAAVVQNIAAYGQRFSDRFLSARAFDLQDCSIVDLDAEFLKFSYRSSSLKESANYSSRFVILNVSMEFNDTGPLDSIVYKDILKLHTERGRAFDDIRARRATVLEVRESKGMVVGRDNWIPSAGSFFLNPVMKTETALRLASLVRGHGFAESLFSWYKPDANSTRFPAALAIRACGFMNGDRWGNVGLSPRHILAICGYPHATGSDVASLSLLIQTRVREKLDILLEPEVRFLGRFKNKDIDTFINNNPFTPGSCEPGWAIGVDVTQESVGLRKS